ncbi:MAG: hypothetical protein AABW85_03660, partial [archaeon]
NFINDASARQEWLLLHQEKNIPVELQGHLVTAINGNFILEGHVPLRIVKEVFEKYPARNFPDIVLYQDRMAEEPDIDNYAVMAGGKIRVCGIKQGPIECAGLKGENFLGQGFLPLVVLGGGLLAGIHPCTIGVLLFFLAFLFTIRKNRAQAFKIGAGYIAGIFLAYFLIGLGLLQVFSFGTPHFAARFSGALVVILGLFNILRFFRPEIKGFGLPAGAKKHIAVLAEKASIPSAFLLGIIVGVCSFGCTAGIYFSIIGLLMTNQAMGMAYLLLYNLMFVLPLAVILLVATNRAVVEKIGEKNFSRSKYLTLAAGIAMVALGVALLFVM